MKPVTEVFAFLSDYDGDEGPVTISTSIGFFPLFGTDGERGERMRDLCQRAADAEGRTITLAVFTHREDRLVLTPRKKATTP